VLGDIAKEHEAKLASYIDDQDRRREARARRALDRLLRYRVRKERARTRSIF
jgi:hypothetical protein